MCETPAIRLMTCRNCRSAHVLRPQNVCGGSGFDSGAAIHKNRSRHDKSMKLSEYDLYTSIMDCRCGTTMKYYCTSRYLTSFVFFHYKCHRDENGYFRFEDITMRIAEVVSDIETTNFCIAGSL